MNIRAEDIEVGDVIRVLGRDRLVTGVSVYRGPLRRQGFEGWLVSFTPGPARGMSVWKGEHVPGRKGRRG